MRQYYRISIKLTLAIVAFILTSGAVAQNNAFELLNNKEYTRLNKLISANSLVVTPQEKLVIQAVLANVFGQPEASNKLILSLSDTYSSLPDSLKFLIIRTEYDNNIKLCRYAEAYISGSKLLKQFPGHFTKEEMQEESEALIIWDVLQKQAPQQLSKEKDTRIYMKRDIAGLWNIPVQTDSTITNFVFDTGAGISVLTESLAKKMNINYPSKKTTEVKGGITGIPTTARIGIAEKLVMGNIIAHNVVFLVFPDSSLSFGGGVYKINGIIGFPVIKELEEITIAHDTLIVPKQVSGAVESYNLAIDQLLPIIYLQYGADELPFTFDTGADGSLFSEVFYSRYESFIKSSGKAGIAGVGGTSGSKKLNIYTMPIELKSFDKRISLPNAQISTDTLSNSQGKFYGNLGQDIIKQFSGMTINFKNSYIVFF